MQDTSVRHAMNLPYIEQFFNGLELLAETTELLDFIPQILLPNLTFQKIRNRQVSRTVERIVI
jgi:hypothetical protein